MGMKYNMIIALAGVFTILSCSKEPVQINQNEIKDFPVVEVECEIDEPSVGYGTEPNTKVYGVEEDPVNKPGKHTVKWNAGDEISMFSVVDNPGNTGMTRGTVLNFSHLRSHLHWGNGTKTFTMTIPNLKELYGASSGLTTMLCCVYPAVTLSATTELDGSKINLLAVPDPSTPLTIPDVQDGTGWKYSVFIARSSTFSAQYNSPSGGGGIKFNLMSVLLRVKLNTTKNITKVVLSTTADYMVGNVGSIQMNSFHYAADAYKNITLASGCPGKNVTIENGGVLPNDLYIAIRDLREGGTYTFTFTAEDGTTTTRSFANPDGYSNRMMRKVLSLGAITLDDWK